jgi:hypothetical protein
MELETYSAPIVEVTDVLRCTIKKKVKMELDGDPMSSSAKEGMEPQEMCSCAAQGGEDFQVRAIVSGDALNAAEGADKGVGIAAPTAQGLSKWKGLSHLSGKFAVAQAEYYFDGKAPKEEWLWHMTWKARLRRFYLNRERSSCPQANTCERKTHLPSVPFLQRLQGIDELIAH